MTKLFFELIQVAIGTRTELSRTLSDTDWKSVYEMAKKQALVGICFMGCQRLPAMQRPSEGLWLQWLGMAAKIQQRNQVVNSACLELVRQYTHDGLACCILKGQGNWVNYPEELREARNPGDIDVWCWPQDPCGMEIAVSDLDGKGAHYEQYHGKEAVIEYVKMLHRLRHDTPEGYDDDNYEIRYHHIDAPSVGGVSVEVHTRPIYFSNPLRNHRLQRWFEEYQGVSESFNGIPIPSVNFNVVYQLAHINHHLFEEGIGLRQLMDYYFVLRALHVEQGEFADMDSTSSPTRISMAQWAEGMGISVMSNTEIMHLLKRFGLARLASAVMYVLAHVFEPNDDDNDTLRYDNWASRWPWMICEPDERLGKHLLEEVMLAGNFGKYDTRIKRENKRFLGFVVSSSITRAIEKTKRNLMLARYYPGEALWEPPFRLYHFFWRKLEMWR